MPLRVMLDVAEFCRTDTVPFPLVMTLVVPNRTPPVPVPLFVIVFAPAVKDLIEPLPLKVWVWFELLLISNEPDICSGTPRVFAPLVDTKFNWALDPPLSITRGVAAEALMVKPCDWFVSPIFKIPTVWVVLSVTVRAAVMLFVKFAVAEVPLAVMLPDQLVAVVQFPLASAVQDPLWAFKLGAKASDIGTKSARVILESFQF